MLASRAKLPVPPSAVRSKDRNTILLAEPAAARLENPAAVIANCKPTARTGKCHSTAQTPATQATLFGPETSDADDNSRNDQSEDWREPKVNLLFRLAEEDHRDTNSTRCSRQQNARPLLSQFNLKKFQQ